MLVMTLNSIELCSYISLSLMHRLHMSIWLEGEFLQQCDVTIQAGMVQAD